PAAAGTIRRLSDSRSRRSVSARRASSSRSLTSRGSSSSAGDSAGVRARVCAVVDRFFAGTALALAELSDWCSAAVPAGSTWWRFVGNKTAGGRGASLDPCWLQAESAASEIAAASKAAIPLIAFAEPGRFRVNRHICCRVRELILNLLSWSGLAQVRDSLRNLPERQEISRLPARRNRHNPNYRQNPKSL